MKLILFTLIFSAWSAQVIPIDKYITKKSCTQHLKAKIIPFTLGDPEYQSSQKFLNEMKEGSSSALYFFSHSPEFSRRSDNRWRAIPDLNGGKSLYVLKVTVQDSGVHEQYRHKSDWDNPELRSIGRFEAFTRVRVSPLFAAIKDAIEHVRGLESHSRQEAYAPPFLLSEVVIENGQLKRKLVDYVNSWVPQTDNEIIVKEFIKDFLNNHIDSLDEKRAVDLFEQILYREIRRLYPFVNNL